VPEPAPVPGGSETGAPAQGNEEKTFAPMTSTGLYVHLPFCRVRCTYCAFAVSADQSLESRYVAALEREIESRADGEPADTIFFGGGTPSRTRPELLERVAAALRRGFRLSTELEFSIEANPEDIDRESIERWRAMGVNRLSIGIQSLHDRELLPLGRVHGSEGARRAMELVAGSGLRFSVDLILGLPNQSTESFRRSLDGAISSGVGHVSVYMLDLEEGTTLARQVAQKKTAVPEDESVGEAYVTAIDLLEKAGFHQYEISNFARSGEECRHNLRYWRRLPYFGFGLSAHSFLLGHRFANVRDVGTYVERMETGASPVDFEETIGAEEDRRERILLGLRQVAGMESREFFDLCGKEGSEWVRQGELEGWVRQFGNRIALTPAGFLLSNEYISRLF